MLRNQGRKTVFFAASPPIPPPCRQRSLNLHRHTQNIWLVPKTQDFQAAVKMARGSKEWRVAKSLRFWEGPCLALAPKIFTCTSSFVHVDKCSSYDNHIYRANSHELRISDSVHAVREKKRESSQMFTGVIPWAETWKHRNGISSWK